MTEGPHGRDRLRELLDAVLDEGSATLGAMAERAYTSPFHFSRQLSKGAGEPPVAMRRRVMLERAAWQLRQGSSVTETAFTAGYDSVEGFARAYARAYGHPPSATTQTGSGGHWLPAPNGIHFHPPMSLWVDAREGADTVNPLAQHLVEHDLEDTRALLEAAKALDDDAYRSDQLPGVTVTAWDGVEDSIAAVLDRLVWTVEVWLAAIEGTDLPDRGTDDLPTLVSRHEAVAGRWLAVWRDVDRRGAWEDRLVDALCDPPESFVLSSVLAHVVTFNAHRRQLVRILLRAAGQEPDRGDPIEWLRSRAGDTGRVGEQR